MSQQDATTMRSANTDMSAPNTTKWIGVGLLGLSLYGALTFWSSIEGQPDPETQYEAWSHFVTTNHYVLSHVLGSILGLIFLIFGAVALGAYLTRSRAGRLGLVAMVITVFSTGLFLPLQGISAFSAPKEGQAYLAGIEEYAKLPTIFADNVSGITSLAFIVLGVVGNVLLGVAVWRSGTLPKWAGALWIAGTILMYLLGIVYAVVILGVRSTPPTVPMGALLLVLSGAWMAWSVLRGPSTAEAASLQARPSVQ